MFRRPYTYEDLMQFRRCWSAVYVAAGLLLVVAGMVARAEILYCKWGTELLRILPAVGLGVFLVKWNKPVKIIAALVRGKWLYPLIVTGIILILGNIIFGFHTPLQVIASLFLLSLFSISCDGIQEGDSSQVFYMVPLSALPLFVNGSVSGAIVCLLAGFGVLYRTFAGSCRHANPQWRLSKYSLVLGILISIAMILVFLHLHLPAWKTDGILLMRSAQQVLKHTVAFGHSRYLGVWAIDYEYAMGHDVTGYLGTLVGHSLGWVFMGGIFTVMVVWLISGALLCYSPAASAADVLARIVSKLAWVSMAVPMALFLLQNLGLLPYIDTEAPLFTRNILSQITSVFLSYLILITGPAEPEENPKPRKLHRDKVYTSTVVGEKTHERLAA